MAAEPIVEEFEQFIPQLVPASEPEPGPGAFWPGGAPHGSWNDVFGFAKSIVKFFGRGDDAVSYVLLPQLNEAIDAAVGSTIKALSGFINRAAEIGLDAQEWSRFGLDAVSANIGAIYQYFDDRINALRAQVHALETLVIPSLQAQILQIQHDLGPMFEFNSAADRQWSVDHIFNPLTDALGQVAAEIPIFSEGAYERAKVYTDDAVNALGLHTLEALVPLTVAVQALQTADEQCTQPMCDTIGPKTDLGKLLKGLKVAAELAALTAFLNMDSNDLAQFIHTITTRLAAIVGDVEQFLGPGGETVAGLVAHAAVSVA